MKTQATLTKFLIAVSLFTTFSAPSFGQESSALEEWRLNSIYEVDFLEERIGKRDKEYISSIQKLPNGNLLLAGTTSKKNGFLSEVTPNGTISWTNINEADGKQDLKAAIIDGAENVIGVGSVKTDVSGKRDFWIASFDRTGNLIWEKSFGGLEDDRAIDAKFLPGGEFVVGGETKSKGVGKNDLFLAKFNSNGDLIWEKTFGSPKNDYFRALLVDSERNIFIGGDVKNEANGSLDGFLAKVDSGGKILWEKFYGTNKLENFSGLYELNESALMLTHTKLDDNDTTFVKIDKDGNVLNEVFYDKFVEVPTFAHMPDGSLFVAGYYLGGTGGSKISFGKMNLDGNLIWQRRRDLFDDSTKVLHIDVTIPGEATMYAKHFRGHIMKVKVASYSSPDAKRKAREIQIAEKSSGVSFGSALGSALKVTTGALLESGGIGDADTLAYLGMANAAANAVTAGEQGKSFEQVQRETNQITSDVNSQITSQSNVRVAAINAETKQIEADNERKRLQAENERLKLELENARLKAELNQLKPSTAVVDNANTSTTHNPYINRTEDLTETQSSQSALVDSSASTVTGTGSDQSQSDDSREAHSFSSSGSVSSNAEMSSSVTPEGKPYRAGVAMCIANAKTPSNNRTDTTYVLIHTETGTNLQDMHGRGLRGLAYSEVESGSYRSPSCSYSETEGYESGGYYVVLKSVMENYADEEKITYALGYGLSGEAALAEGIAEMKRRNWSWIEDGHGYTIDRRGQFD